MSIFRYTSDQSETVRKKLKFYIIATVFCFVFLWMRVWYLQILQGENFTTLSENNRIRRIVLSPYRGIIKDRNGEILVSIRPSFNLYLVPEDIRDLQGTLDRLAGKIEFDRGKLLADIRRAAPFSPVLIRADISRRQVAFVEENNQQLPGVLLRVEPLRDYVYKGLAAHILGYLGEISQARLDNPEYSTYQQGDLVGKNGLENIFESDLQGQKGYKDVEVDVAGRELRTLRRLPPKSGDNLTLTLDLRLQQVLEKAMTGEAGRPLAGAALVIKVDSGEIVAMTSQPSFDPNLFAAGISREHWRQVLRGKFHPLQNRAIDGQYPPGSTYKIVTAYAGLREKVITPQSTIYCPGSFRLGRGLYRCWKKGGHGRIKVHDALVQSCDVFFYTVGNRLGIDTLARYAKQFGLGNFTGLRLGGEKTGLVPTTQWKLLAKKQPWLLGETISASIGQGFNLVTPIQQAQLMAAVANGGRLYRPRLVKQIVDPFGKIRKTFEPEVLKETEFDETTLELIRRALLGAVNGPHGTGRRAALKDIRVSGKTGTAQVVRMKSSDEKLEEDEIPYKFRDHAWFIAFAPFEEPEIAVAVIVEHGGHGGAAAAPIARKIIQAYFQHPPLEKDSANLALESKTGGIPGTVSPDA